MSQLTRLPIEDSRRRQVRYLVRWKVAVIYDEETGRERFYGIAWDISNGGLSLYSDNNIFNEKPITLLISIPSNKVNGRSKVVEVKAVMMYTYVCSKKQRFRTGIRFKQFKDQGKKILRTALEEKIPAGDTRDLGHA